MIIWAPSVDPLMLDPQFRQDVEGMLGRSPFAWTVTSGFRSLVEQRVLWDKYQAGGARAAPPGKSAHNFGLAVDVALDGDPDRPGLQPDWKPDPGDGWYWLRDAIRPHPRLHHGSSFGDWPHIERYVWKHHRDWLRRIAPTLTEGDG